MAKHEEYGLLRNEESRMSEDDNADFADGLVPAGVRRRMTDRVLERLSATTLVTLLALSGLANLVVVIAALVVVLRLQAQMATVSQPSTVSRYAKLAHDPAVQFPYSVGYGPEITNHSLADERWEAIDIDLGAVALTKEYAEAHNLAPSQPFPWDESKSLYTITAFHTLHCLKNIHRLLYDAHHGRPLSRDVGHAMHCVDHMRKDVLCNADDFLLPTPPGRYGTPGPRGQSRVCRNWDQLVAWAQANHACYAQLTDDEEAFAKHHSEIERYRNCPPGSPYEQRMREYFEDEEQ